MQQESVRRNPDAATPAELRTLLAVRLEVLDAATRQESPLAPLPIAERWGWQAVLKTHGRDAGGHLMATVKAYQPGGLPVYTRNVRLVPEQPLPKELR